MKIKRSKFSCRRDNLTIRGVEYRPEEGTNFPIAIISHGFMANSSSVRNYAKSLPYTNSSRLVLMGCSQGGFVSALTAAELPDEVSRLILFYPALCIPDDARKGQMMFTKFDPQHVPETIKCGPMLLGHSYPEAVMEMNPYEEIRKYQGPVLIVHGTADDIVDVSYAKEAWKSYIGDAKCAAPKTQLLILEGAKHGFSRQYDEYAMFGVKCFLEGRTQVLEAEFSLNDCGRKTGREKWTATQPYEGTAAGPYFSGNIQPEAMDGQKCRRKKRMPYNTDYVIKGTDYTGTECQIHVVNESAGDGSWKPMVTTDSKALDFLNGADCVCKVQRRKQGLIVRVYTRIRKR